VEAIEDRTAELLRRGGVLGDVEATEPAGDGGTTRAHWARVIASSASLTRSGRAAPRPLPLSRHALEA
jgi:hypothetical protein